MVSPCDGQAQFQSQPLLQVERQYLVKSSAGEIKSSRFSGDSHLGAYLRCRAHAAVYIKVFSNLQSGDFRRPGTRGEQQVEQGNVMPRSVAAALDAQYCLGNFLTGKNMRLPRSTK